MNTDYSVYVLSLKEKFRFLAIGYICSFAVAYLFYHSLYLSAVAGLVPVLLIKRYSIALAEKRKAFLLIQFKDMLYSLSSSVAAGRQLAEALDESLESLRTMYEENTPLVKELDYISRCKNENKQSEDKLLLKFAQRSHCEDIQNFTEVCITCRETGGNLMEVLASTCEILNDKMSIEKEIKTLVAQKKLEGKIITVMPLCVIIFLNIISPDYLQVLYSTFAGRIVMTLALAGMATAYLMTERLTDIEV